MKTVKNSITFTEQDKNDLCDLFAMWFLESDKDQAFKKLLDILKRKLLYISELEKRQKDASETAIKAITKAVNDKAHNREILRRFEDYLLTMEVGHTVKVLEVQEIEELHSLMCSVLDC